MTIEIIKKKISTQQLGKIAKENYIEMVKGVVDIEQNILALGGELHADAEAVLLEQGSRHGDLWGFSIYLDRSKEERMDFTSFINIRPSHGNKSLEVRDEHIRGRMIKIIDDLIA